MHTRSPRTLALLTAAGTMITLAGCTNPFGDAAMDYTPVASADKTRQVDRFDIDLYEAEPTPDLDDEARQGQVVETARDRFEGRERAELLLAEVRQATLENNLGLKAVLVSPTIAAEGVNVEEGKFDSAFTLQGQLSESDSPTVSGLQGNQVSSQFLTPGFTVPLRTGGTATVSMPINRLETDAPFTAFNPSYTSDLEFSFSHNLLRNAGRRATTHQIRVSDLSRQVTEAQTKLEVIRQIAAADRSYWRVYAAQQALEVRIEAYTVAVEQLESSQRKVVAGSGAEIDVVRARSEVAARVEAVIRSQNALLQSQRELKRIINIDGLDVDSSTMIMTMTDPDPVEYIFDAEVLTGQAVINRMEMLELEIQLARDAANIAFDRNQALPLLALSYTYRVNGLGTSLSNSVDTLVENDFEDWSIGLNASVPLGNNERKSRLAQSILTRLQRLATREDREQAITKEVYDAIDQLATNWQRILANRESVLLAVRALDAEQRQFEVGRSNSINVLVVNNSLLEARLLEIQSIADYEIAQVDLAFATGTLLGAARVDWAASDPRTSASPEDMAEDFKYSPIDGVFNNK